MSFYKKANNFEKESVDNQQDILRVLIEKKIRTTMIGAIDSIEKYFGYLFGHRSGDLLTEEEEEMLKVFQDLRKEILDKGNNQIRLLNEELSKFEISRKVYHLVLPVKGN